MKTRMIRIVAFTALGILLLVSGLFGCLEYTTQQFTKAATYRTNQKKYIKPDTTEVFLLGTIHQPKNNLTIDSLYNALELIKPDLILFEYDSTGFDDEMNLKRRYCYVFPGFLSRFQENEGPASKKYASFNANAIIRPYEWTLRNTWNKEKGILKMPDKIFTAIDELLILKKLSKAHEKIVREFYGVSNALENYSDSSIFAINTKQQDSISKKRADLYYHKIKEVVDQETELAGYKDFWATYEKYWDLRNKAMAQNICNYTKRYPQRRIVVLNGYFHRYYLRQELEPQQKSLNFKLMEINSVK